jgi:hypothetical protein
MTAEAAFAPSTVKNVAAKVENFMVRFCGYYCGNRL